MTDVHSPEQRSRNMAAISGKNTKPELLIRSELHALGFRFRIHYSKLPGKPDLAFPKYRAVMQINGCFWHKHECPLFRWPASNTEFWREKIERNCVRDAETESELSALGWRTLILWECALKGKYKLEIKDVAKQIESWLMSKEKDVEIAGKQN